MPQGFKGENVRDFGMIYNAVVLHMFLECIQIVNPLKYKYASSEIIPWCLLPYIADSQYIHLLLLIFCDCSNRVVASYHGPQLILLPRTGLSWGTMSTHWVRPTLSQQNKAFEAFSASYPSLSEMRRCKHASLLYHPHCWVWRYPVFLLYSA